MIRIIFNNDKRVEVSDDYKAQYVCDGRFIEIYKKNEDGSINYDEPRYIFNSDNIYLIEEGLPEKEREFDLNAPIMLRL